MDASLWLGADRMQLADLDSAGRLRASMGACRSRTNAEDRLPLASLGRVQGGDGVVEGRDVADVRPQPSVTHPLDDLTQLGTIGLDNEVDRQAVVGPRLGRPDDGHQCSSGSNQACGPLLDVAADDIEHQIDEAEATFKADLEKLLKAEGHMPEDKFLVMSRKGKRLGVAFASTPRGEGGAGSLKFKIK